MYMSPRQVAHALDIPERTVLGWITKGWLAAQTTTHGQRVRHRVSLEAARALMDERALEPRRPPTETRIGDQLEHLRIEYEREIAQLRDTHRREIIALREELPALIRMYTAQASELRASIAQSEDMRFTVRPNPPAEHAVPMSSYPSSRSGRSDGPPGTPDGTIRLIHFAKRHKVPDGTLKSQADRGDVPHTARATASRDGREERWATPDDQRGIIDYWRRAGTWYTPCDNPDCPCHRDIGMD